jgi:hypothetical protein
MFDTSPLPSLFGKKNTDRIKTEYEVAFAALAHNFLRNPAVGDLVHTTGRWIVDCGHSTYKTELHPIFSYAIMKTVVSETNGFTKLEDDLFNGKPATRVAIWSTAGFRAATTMRSSSTPLAAPAQSRRRAPRGQACGQRPGGTAAGRDHGVRAACRPGPSHVHLKFSSPAARTWSPMPGRQFESGRQYWGIWTACTGD